VTTAVYTTGGQQAAAGYLRYYSISYARQRAGLCG
jgi:hypothetical protein